jgi:CHAT domain-containing protein/tetratricopeptide (TPR) repeat protein
MMRKLWFWGALLTTLAFSVTGNALPFRPYAATSFKTNLQLDHPCAIADSLAYDQAMALYDSLDAEYAIDFLEVFFAQRKSKACTETGFLGDLWHKYGVFLYLTDQYRQAELAYERALATRIAVLGTHHPDVARSYHNLGVALKEKGDFINALPPLKEAVALRQKLEAPEGVADSYFEQAAVYNAMGEYNIALEYLHAALPVFREYYGEQSYEVAQTYNEMGIAHWNLGEYQPALKSIQLAQAVFVALYGADDTDVALTHINLGNIYDDLGEGELALRQYKEAISIYQQYEGYDLSLGLVYNNLGVVLRKLDRYEESRKALEQSLKAKNRALATGPHPNKAATLDNIGDLYLDMGLLDKALRQYQRAIFHRVPGFTDTLGYSNPTIINAGIRGSWQKLLIVMASKAKTLKALYEETRDQAYLEQALSAYYTCEQVVAQLQQQYETRKSKLFLQENALPVYEEALETCFLLYQITRKDAYVEDAFFFIEQSRATLLAATLRDAQAKNTAGIPAEILAQEQGLKANIGYLESKLALSADTTRRAPLQRVLADLRHQLQLFTANLEEQYPTYYFEKYQRTKASTGDLVRLMNAANAGWVSYFAGEKRSYALFWDGADWQISALPARAEWEPLIFELTRALSQQQHNLPLETFQSIAYPLYTALWAPLGENLPKRVFVSPAGAIHHLPFSILPGSKDGGHWKELPYLLHKHQITYAYSAAVLLQQENRPIPASNHAFLGVAPIFAKNSGLAALSYNQHEVNTIEQSWKGRVLIGPQATKQAFTELAGNYQILHLSTHAGAAEGGWIAFSNTLPDQPDSKLYLSELYPLNLAAEMAVLSACETATGELARGEGVMSLARGLSYAGCPSTVATLWPVLQGSSSGIILEFYDLLKAGHTKDAALQEAQLSYLMSEETDLIGAHPALWGGLVHLGTPRPVPQPGQRGYLWWAPGAIAVGILLWLIGHRALLSRAQQEE